MNDASTVSAIGHYCGRFAPGFFGEPLNSFSNIVFVLGALYAWRKWRLNGSEDRWQLLLFALAASIGVGSFVFHSMPTPSTLWGDLVPIQIFGLALFGYVMLRYLHLSPLSTVAMLLAFFLARQFWIVVAPHGAFGGGITHVPTLVLLIAVTFLVRHKGFPLWRYLAAASVVYVAALAVRSWDLAVCSSFPWGLHWAWHLLSALTASLLVLGIAITPPNNGFQATSALTRRRA
jgi:hypothetical protein